MLSKQQKAILRVALRIAIRKANEEWLFNCYNCFQCVDDSNKGQWECLQGVLPIPSEQLMAGPFLPDCFSYNYVDSPYADVLELMTHMGLDFHDAEHGWGTVVIRVIKRANRFGHLINIKPGNLEV